MTDDAPFTTAAIARAHITLDDISESIRRLQAMKTEGVWDAYANDPEEVARWLGNPSLAADIRQSDAVPSGHLIMIKRVGLLEKPDMRIYVFSEDPKQ